MKPVILFVLCLLASGIVSAADLTVGQKDKKFTELEINIAIGDTIHFRNDDPFSHNVYSLSEVKSFDLGSYPKGQARSVTFDQPGVVEVGCAIHFDMELKVNVQ